MCLAPERGRGFEEYGGSSGPSLKSGKDGWNGGLPPCQVLNEVGERDYQRPVRYPSTQSLALREKRAQRLGAEAGCTLRTATSGEVLSPVERKSGAYGP